MSAGEAFVTLATTESYCMGATALGKSLRRHRTTRRVVALVTPNISQESRLFLQSIFDEVIIVDVMDSRDHHHLSMLKRPELGVTFTKIWCWTLTHYSKCVFLDADTLVLCNVDELFDRDELSAASDPGWPDCFNSGVFVFKPSLHTHALLTDHAIKHGSFDGGDQGLLNSFFSTWSVEDIRKHLPFIYNLSANSVYSYRPAFEQFGHSAKIVHFTGAVKPWNVRSFNPTERFVSLWWREYHDHSVSEGRATSEGRNNDGREEPLQEATGAEAPSIEEADVSYPSSPFQQALPAPLPSPKPIEDSEINAITSLEEASGQGTPLPVDLEELIEESNEETRDEPQQNETELEQMQHRRMWEMGQMDYMGRDAFENIQKMLDRFLE